MQYQKQLDAMRTFFRTGETRSVKFRIKNLQALQASIFRSENAITAALFADLKKSPEEAYASEIGLVLSEIREAIRMLDTWMQPETVATNLVNLPSRSKIYRDPLGVVLIIAPWNYPFQLLLNPLIGALAGGNCAVVKPSEHAPATAQVLATILRDALPENIVCMIQGEGEKILPEMITAFRFDHIFYTGSIPVGRSIYELAAKQLVPVTLELGGKSPCIVEASANLRVAAKRIVLGKFLNAGQTCIAPDYVLVAAAVKEPLVAHLKAAINRFYSQEPANSREYPRIINEKRFDRLLDYLAEGKLLFGGASNRSALYIGPTLLEPFRMDSPVMKEEIFGPILPIISYAHTEEARAVIRENPNPLAFYLFTSDRQSEADWIRNTEFGGGCINNTVWHFANKNLPFGGVGNSGTGQYHGKYSFDTFTRQKAVLKTPVWFDPSIKYPPLKGRLGFLKWIFK